MQQQITRSWRSIVFTFVVLALVVPLERANAVGYELIAGGSRRGSISLYVEQAGQSASASPLVNPVDPQLPDNGWTGAFVTLGGAPPFANVLAQGDGRYWLATTPDAIDLRVRAIATRNINGGINTGLLPPPPSPGRNRAVVTGAAIFRKARPRPSARS